ncbi:MAG TPA: type IX secretion system membrane protein PorP/SprF [Bacteroidia bacterium]|nr:type IX secretion system membrane protein PorP/SprF [Bacteroidia bacterium]
MKKLMVLAIAFSAIKSFAQQDPQYNLYQYNQMVINPAYAGARDAIAIVADVRKQWVGFDGAPTTAAFSVHSPLANNKIGVGINAMSDKIGAKSISSFYGNFSYILKLNNKAKLAFGARAGYSSYKFNFNDVKYKDSEDAAYTDLNSTNKGALDVDAGLYLRTNTFYVGLSATHLNQGSIYKNSFLVRDTGGVGRDYTLSYVLRPHVFLTMGKSFVIKENFLFSPSIMVKNVASKTTVDVNLNFFAAKRVWFGVFVRQAYGFGALFQVYVTNQFRVGYSYDIGTGPRKYLGSSHEVMIGFDIKKNKSKMISPRFL